MAVRFSVGRFGQIVSIADEIVASSPEKFGSLFRMTKKEWPPLPLLLPAAFHRYQENSRRGNCQEAVCRKAAYRLNDETGNLPRHSPLDKNLVVHHILLLPAF